MQRASVDLPQPVSPTRPSVSPRRTSRLTPSTACTTWRAAEQPVGRAGKCLTRPSTRTSDVAPAPSSTRRSRTPAALDDDAARAASASMPRVGRASRPTRVRSAGHLRAGGARAAAVHHVRAARVERAAGRQADHARRLPGDRRRAAPRRRSIRGATRAARACTGGAAAVERAPVAVLHRPAGVHHEHVVGDLGDHSEVVRDQDDRRAELALQRAQQLEDLRLHGDVERGRRLVGDQQLGPSASAIAIIARCRMPPENWCG